MKNLKPLNDKILLKIEEVKYTTEGGLYIPDTARDEASEGTVISVGEGVTLQDGSIRPLTVKEGDRLLFLPNSGIPIKLEGEDYRLIAIRDVLGKVIE